MSDIEKIEQQSRASFENVQKALIVGVYFSGRDTTECKNHLEELGQLAKTLGVKETREILCPVKKYTAATYIGKGKVEEFAAIVEMEKIDVIMFDDEITPNQQKNIEAVTGVPVIDRREVILEIFGLHARTKEAMLQIEMAKIRHQLPRLKRMWTHLSRQRASASGGSGGGGGYLRGTGEKQIETDRRLLNHKLRTIEAEVKNVVRQREQKRKSRLKSNIPTFSIIGYTNAGKSTLLNALTGSDVLVEDKLFATLDTTSRSYSLPSRSKVVLVDTVGFIRKLPHSLIKAFRSTLEEVCYTDILIHLIDCSQKGAMERYEATLEVLKELGIEEKRVIVCLNKVDLVESTHFLNRFKLLDKDAVFISAVTGQGFDDLLKVMEREVSKFSKKMLLRIPQKDYFLVEELKKEATIVDIDYEDNDILVNVLVPEHMEAKCLPYKQSD